MEFTNEIVTAKVIVSAVQYCYDEEDKMTKKILTFADGTTQTVHYENSEDNTVVKFNAGGKTITAHSKTDSFGRKVFDELQLGTGFVSRQFHYHAGEVTEEHKENAKLKSSATTKLVSQIVLSGGRTISYEYDEEERITKVDDSVDGITTYTYDALGQLVTETVNGITTKFEYDNYGNILAKGVVDETGEIAEATKITYAYGDEHWHDLLTAYNGQSITYDAQGNPISYLGHELTWEKGRQLKSFENTEDNGTKKVISYTYNANGIRTSKTVDGIKHTYTLDGTNILREEWNGNTLIPFYDNEDTVCGILYNNEPYYFQKNLQGDIIGIVDKSSKVVANYFYDAWGIPTITQDSTDCGIAEINPYRYRGYYFDTDIQLYYLQSRYYDPEIGRFVNGDDCETVSIEETGAIKNLFAHCKNDPVNNIDEQGNAIWEIIKKVLLGFLNGLIYQMISDVIESSYRTIILRNGSGFYFSPIEDYIVSIIKEIGAEFISGAKKKKAKITLLVGGVGLIIKYLPKIIKGKMNARAWMTLLVDVLSLFLTVILVNASAKLKKQRSQLKARYKKHPKDVKFKMKDKKLRLSIKYKGIGLSVGIPISEQLINLLLITALG